MIQESAVQVMWRSDDRWLRRMEWLIVSKAADRSRRRIISWLESESSRRSLVIFNSAVSVFFAES